MPIFTSAFGVPAHICPYDYRQVPGAEVRAAPVPWRRIVAVRDMEWAPSGIDVTVPSVARIYDYVLGGKDNFAVDREVADAILEQAPAAREAARANRRFLGRAVEFLADAGVRQFLDLGTGLPSRNNVHEVAQRVRSDARVVYVDNDPAVLAHARALLARDDSTAVVREDIRDPERILANPVVRGVLDFSRPVAVMFVAVLHFVTDDEDPWGIVSTLTERLVPGSYLALSHGTFDGPPAEAVQVVQERYQKASAPGVFRGRDAIGRFFAGFDLVDPGLVGPTHWRADAEERERPGGEWILAGVGRKPYPAGWKEIDISTK
jgi:S-adenosyl methyltransferase